MAARVLPVFGLLTAVLLSCPAGAAAVAQGKSWSEIAKLPDFTTGIFEVAATAADRASETQLSLTPAYAAMLQAYQDRKKAGDEQDTPNANCVPTGMPGIMSPPFPIQFLYSPGQVVILFEVYSQSRHIYTDGRAHPIDPDLTFNGHSIGHWEGDTLVVDTVGISPETPLSSGTRAQNFGVRHSDKLHIIERMRLTDPETLLVETTVEDPEALAKPWKHTRTFKRHRDWTLAEYVCQQNNRDRLDENGHASVDLTPPLPAGIAK
ncbi:MAG: hypothetical protein ABIQ86_03215 [Steroidobacteraceae bacterium]